MLCFVIIDLQDSGLVIILLLFYVVLTKSVVNFSYRNYFSFFSHPAHGSGLKAWMKTLSNNNFAFDAWYFPKVLFISISILLSTPFRVFEKMWYRKAIAKVKIKEPIFILGHPRSGTTFLHYLMSKDPSFSFCSTYQAMIPHLFLSGSKIFPALLSGVLPTKRPMDNLKLGSHLPKEEEFAMASMGAESLVSGYYFPKYFMNNFRDHVVFAGADINSESKWKNNFEYLLKKLSYANKGKRLLLKSPGNTGRIKQILELYPDAKFIHIYRDPYHVYQSNLHLYKKLLPMLSFQSIGAEAVDKFVIESYELLMKKYFSDRELIDTNNLVEIRYEEFEQNPLKALEGVYSKLGLDGFSTTEIFISEELKSYQNYEKNVFQMNLVEKEKIEKQWGFAFEKLGYSTALTS